jgi:hypothetical protein
MLDLGDIRLETNKDKAAMWELGRTVLDWGP